MGKQRREGVEEQWDTAEENREGKNKNNPEQKMPRKVNHQILMEPVDPSFRT